MCVCCSVCVYAYVCKCVYMCVLVFVCVCVCVCVYVWVSLYRDRQYKQHNKKELFTTTPSTLQIARETDAPLG